MKCKNCGSDVPISIRDCPSCGIDNGYPNVRMADLPAEIAALDARVAQANASAVAGGFVAVLDDF